MRGYITVIACMFIALLLYGCAGIPSPQEVSAEAIDTVNQTSSVVNNELEPWVLGVIILLAGWAIPSPMEMIRGLVNIFKVFRK